MHSMDNTDTDNKSEPNVWNHIDAVLVINLESRPERWERFSDSAKGILPEDKITKFPASLGLAISNYGMAPWFRGKPRDSRWAGRAGCALSHQRIMMAAVEKNWDIILVLEDDADFIDTNKDELDALLQKLLSERSSWDICYLGFSKTTGPSQSVGTIENRGVFKISGCGTTHAYLVNSTARDWLFKHLPNEKTIWPWIAQHRAIDRWYSRNLSWNLKILAISPSIVTQASGYSDLVESHVDYNSEFPGKVVQFTNSNLTYTFARFWWRVSCLVGSSYDWIRYLIKKSNGF